MRDRQSDESEKDLTEFSALLSGLQHRKEKLFKNSKGRENESVGSECNECSAVKLSSFTEFMQFSAGQQRQLKPENKKEPEDKLPELV